MVNTPLGVRIIKWLKVTVKIHERSILMAAHNIPQNQPDIQPAEIDLPNTTNPLEMRYTPKQMPNEKLKDALPDGFPAEVLQDEVNTSV